MEVALGSGGFDFGVDEAAQTDAECWDSLGVKGSVGHQRDVGFELARIVFDVLGDRLAANFLFAFNQELDVQRELAVVDRAQGFNGLDVHVELALVVGRAACIEVALAFSWLERRRKPELERVGGLDVVVAVAEDGGFVDASVKPIRIDERVALRRNDLDIFKAGVAKFLRRPSCGFCYIGNVFRRR